MSNLFFSDNVFYSIRKLNPHLSIFMTSYLYLLLNWKRLKLACGVKGNTLRNTLIRNCRTACICAFFVAISLKACLIQLLTSCKTNSYDNFNISHQTSALVISFMCNMGVIECNAFCS